jgi:hypothetical protein
MWCRFFSVKRRNASQLGAVRRESFFRMRIKLAGALVPLNGGIELRGIKGFEPCAKPRHSRGASCSTAFSMSSAVVMSEI